MLRSRARAGRDTPPASWTEEAGERAASADDAGIGVRIARGEELFAEHAAATDIFKLVSGSVRLVKLVNDGRRQICEFVLPGEFLGLASHERHPFSAEAIEDCVAVRYRRGVIEARITADAGFAAEVRRCAARGLTNAYERMVFLCHRSSTARVAWFLQSMHAQLTGPEPASESFRLPMTRSDIGDYLGMALETVSRAFSQLKREGAITETAAGVISIADPARLRYIADHD